MGKNGKLGKPARAPLLKAKTSNKIPASNAENSSTVSQSNIPQQLQQRCLNVFRDALWTGPEDMAAVQEVKGHLYNREFAQAFGSEHYLRAYALRWSAARALGYLQVFDDLQDVLISTSGTQAGRENLKLLGLGGGAGAELVALAGWLSLGHQKTEPEDRTVLATQIELIDIARWDSVVKVLEDTIVNPPPISKYASAAAREANVSLVPPSTFKVSSQRRYRCIWYRIFSNSTG